MVRVLVESLLRCLLPFQIQGRHHRAAGLGLNLQFIEDLLAVLIEHQAPHPGAARQLLVELELQPRATLMVLENRVVMVDGPGGKFGLNACITKNMTSGCFVGVKADVIGHQLGIRHSGHGLTNLLRQGRSPHGGSYGQRQPAAVFVVCQNFLIAQRTHLQPPLRKFVYHPVRNAQDVRLALIHQLPEVDRGLVRHLGGSHHAPESVRHHPTGPRHRQGHGAGVASGGGIGFTRGILHGHVVLRQPGRGH